MTPFFKDYRAENLKDFHNILSKGLDNNNNGLLGEYRVDGACIDMDTIFLQPSLISEAVEKSIRDLLVKLKSGSNIYLETMLFVAKFISVISRAFLKQIEEINDNLELAGKDIIEPLELSKEFKEKIEKELSLY